MYPDFPENGTGNPPRWKTIFSVVKRKLSARAPGRSLATQICRALRLGPTYNLYHLGIDPRGRMPTEPSLLTKKGGGAPVCGHFLAQFRSGKISM